MHVLAVRFDLHVPLSRSLKARRAAVRPVIDRIRSRFRLSVAEVDGQDTWQRAAIGVAIVSSSPDHCEEVADRVERFVWNQPDIEVTGVTRSWVRVE